MAATLALRPPCACDVVISCLPTRLDGYDCRNTGQTRAWRTLRAKAAQVIWEMEANRNRLIRDLQFDQQMEPKARSLQEHEGDGFGAKDGLSGRTPLARTREKAQPSRRLLSPKDLLPKHAVRSGTPSRTRQAPHYNGIGQAPLAVRSQLARHLGKHRVYGRPS